MYWYSPGVVASLFLLAGCQQAPLEIAFTVYCTNDTVPLHRIPELDMCTERHMFDQTCEYFSEVIRKIVYSLYSLVKLNE